MKKIFILSWMIGLAAALVSCEALVEVDEDRITLANEANTELHFSGTGGSKSIVLKATSDWSAVSDQKWCEVSPSSGLVSDIKLTIAVEASNEDGERKAQVTITAGTAVVYINVIQAEQGVLSVNDADYVVESAGGTFEVETRHNLEYGVNIPRTARWIKEVTSKSVEHTVHVFQVEENEEYDERSAVITFVSTDGEVKEKITVVQLGREREPVSEFSFSVTHKNASFALPEFWGEFAGTVFWGDGASKDFDKATSHTYAAAGEWTVLFELSGEPEDLEFEFPDIVGITELDLSDLSKY